jgi:hypothetical protein
MRWSAAHAEFRSASRIAVLFLIAGDRAGTDSPVRFPDPSEKRTVVEQEGPQHMRRWATSTRLWNLHCSVPLTLHRGRSANA